MAQVARHHRETVLQGSGGDQEISAVMAEFGGKLPPAAGGGQIHRQQPLAMEAQQLIEPDRQLCGEGWIRVRRRSISRSISPMLTALRKQSSWR